MGYQRAEMKGCDPLHHPQWQRGGYHRSRSIAEDACLRARAQVRCTTSRLPSTIERSSFGAQGLMETDIRSRPSSIDDYFWATTSAPLAECCSRSHNEPGSTGTRIPASRGGSQASRADTRIRDGIQANLVPLAA